MKEGRADIDSNANGIEPDNTEDYCMYEENFGDDYNVNEETDEDDDQVSDEDGENNGIDDDDEDNNDDGLFNHRRILLLIGTYKKFQKKMEEGRQRKYIIWRSVSFD